MENQITINNPYGVAVGALCFNIRVFADYIGHDKAPVKFDGAYAITMEAAAYHPDELEGAATLAFQFAQQDGLKARMMAFCQFFHLQDGSLDEPEQWVEIMFGEEGEDES